MPAMLSQRKVLAGQKLRLAGPKHHSAETLSADPQITGR